IDTYRGTWDRLAAKEDWTDRQVNLGAIAAFNAENHERGARVTAVTEGGPAAQSGMKVGDIIRRFDNNRIRHCEDLVEAINRKKPTDTVAIDIQREGKNMKVSVILAAGFAKAGPFLGISGQDYRDNKPRGVSIESVVPGTPAEAAKLEKGDVITTFKGQTIADLSELQEIIRGMKAGESAELIVLRGSETLKLTITLGMKG
ncbi:MAG: PDZ domain-containing protein, partial [Phycisphaeraceae bacterium]